LQSSLARPIELLYESTTARVFRQGPGAAVVCKEPLGAGAAQRLAHEAAMVARLAGIQGVVQLAGGEHLAGVIAMQNLGGADLAQHLSAGRLEPADAVNLAIRLTATLAAVHQAGVIHRDINPANILLTANGDPVLIDFDLAVLAGQNSTPASYPGAIEGTLGYLAPEQSGRTGHSVDQRADLYALGATLYEMATGRPPFEATDALQLIHDHLVREPVAPAQIDPRVPPGLSSIILRLLAKSPEHRYQSAEGLLHDLKRLRSEIAAGRDGRFALGEHDFAARIAAPAQLVGRESEIAVLAHAFSNALHSACHTVLIEGEAGVGKSALVRELRPTVAAAGGWFVYGKFDQFQKDGATADAVTQAARGLGRLLLALPRDELAEQRQRILDALGRSAGLIARELPEFARLLGDLPQPPEVDPRQAELQLQQAMVDLLGAVAASDRPLVIVLDDLQWAGATSLRTFERLMGESRLRGLLLVGVLRAEALDEHRVLAAMLPRWRANPGALVQLTLGNLLQAGLESLIAQMLRLQAPAAEGLASAVGAMTRGNPYETVEMVNALRREGVLRLVDQGWRWEPEAILHFVGQGNVVDLLAARIARLPPASRELLECMSCLGSSVENRLLRAAAGLSDDELASALRPPLEDGLVLADHAGGLDIVHFRHDRVQQAVLDAMDDAQREHRQIAMARRLAGQSAFEADAAQQYLACIAQVSAAQEQRHAAQLFHRLAQKLASAGTYALAERYLAEAGALLAKLADAADTLLRWQVDAARHAALYSLGRLGESDPLFAQLQARAVDPLEMVEPTCLQMRSLDMRGRVQDAMMLGIELLGQLGLRLPADWGASDANRRLDALDDWIAREAAMDHASRPQIRDARLLGIAKLLGRSVRSALVRFESDAIVWLLLESQRLWDEHGPCPELVANLGRMSGMLISVRQDYRCAHAIARHVLTVGEALGYEPQTSEARGVFSTYACHWMDPVEDSFRHVARAYEGVQAGGDASFACYVHLVMFTALVEIAPTADATLDELEAGIALCRRTGNLHAATLHASLRQTLRALRGLTEPFGSFEDAQFREDDFLASMGQLPFVENAYSECRAMHALIMGEADVLARSADRGMLQLKGLAGYYMTVYAHFFVAIARAWELQQGISGNDRAAKLAQLDACREWMAARAADQPYNFLHLLRYIEAEQAWAMGDRWKAAANFDAALVESQSRQRPWHRAVICERAGLFHLSLGFAHTGRQLLGDACDQYEAWGAVAKVRQMQGDHAFLKPPAPPSLDLSPAARAGRSNKPGGSVGISPESLDLMGVLSASQALSSETGLESLVARVTEVLASLTGATKVLVLSWHDEQWWLHAPTPGESKMPLAQAADRGLLPLSVARYADRTGQPLLVDDALQDDRFARDAYFTGLVVCSLLAVPIAGQGAGRAMLILENRLGKAAFNAQRLDAVMLIAGQLAVSLANAQLYENLEQRVQARTRELEQTQAQLVDTARRAGKAEIANNVLHNVGNVLNSINVSASVVRRVLDDSKAQGLSRAVDLMNELERKNELGRFIESDKRGKALIVYLNEIVGALRKERERMLGDLDRVVSSVDHISYVVATQQSHAGPSSVLETARPGELMDEALRLGNEWIQRFDVTVVRNDEDIAPMALDRQRLLQILVNLIGNAAQAMQSAPKASRQLTLGTSMIRDASGERLRMTVRDQGEGIAPENLKRIFAHGFTTRESGHGFGLHSSALAAVEMGAKLEVHSEGKGHGAVFTIEIPVPGKPQGQ
jgi:signal transduction histidine kinase